jgi:L-alanine-DL-glutamate epimerase-like enolase superfamily enzyme
MTDHYNSSLEQLHGDIRRVAPLLTKLRPDNPFDVWKVLATQLPGSPFALAAIDAAVHDLRARLLGLPLWQTLGLDPPHGLRSSFSIGLDDPSVMVGKLRERLGWSAKVSSRPGDDCAAATRRHTDAPFYVDGNRGWELSQVHSAGRDAGARGFAHRTALSPCGLGHARILKRRSPIPVTLTKVSIRRPT